MIEHVSLPSESLLSSRKLKTFKTVYEMFEWNQRTMSVVQPLLDYLAPEYVVGGRCDPYADIFSLGILTLTVFNKGKQPFDNKNSLDCFRKNVEKVWIIIWLLLTSMFVASVGFFR